MAGFNMTKSMVASAQDPRIFEINSIGTSTRKRCRSTASRIIFCISTKGALPASTDSFESIPESCDWARDSALLRIVHTPIYLADPTSGALCGLVCAGYNFAHPDELPLSYVATLWPMLTRVISMDRGEAYPRGVEYPMIDPVSVEEPHG